MFWLVVAAHAQSYEQVAPKTPPVAPAPTLPEAPATRTPAPANDDQIIVPALHGLVFLASQSALQSGGITTEGLTASGIALLETPEFRALMSPYLGQPLSLRVLNRLTRDVVLYFRTHGRPVVDVLVPEQNISTGTVQILVIEGRLGEVRAEGNRWFTAEQLTSTVRARPGAVIEGGPLLDDVTWLNQNPFRQVDLVFTRGKNLGETDVVLRTHDRYPLRVYTGYEDSGNALTGFDRVLVGANWGNAFGRDEQLNYQLSASPDFKKLVAHSASYVVPIVALRHTLTVFGSYATSKPELAGGIFALDGRTWQVSARYRVPIAGLGTWTRALTAGLDFKRSNNNLSFGGTQIFAQENDVIQAIAGFSASNTDKQGITSVDFTLALSPGSLTNGNETSAYRAARSFARPEYAYARLELERMLKLPGGFSWVVRGTAQLASTNLLGSEQLGLGGANSLRGYEEREANGDNGFILVNELHGPPQSWSFGLKFGSTPARFDPLVFVDYGMVQSHQRLPGEPSQLTLASAGLGFRYQIGANLNARFDYGWQLKDSSVSDGRRSSRAHVSVTIGF